MIELVLTPSNVLTVKEHATAEVTPSIPMEFQRELLAGFAKDQSELILLLAAWRDTAPLPPVFVFWRDFGALYLNELCHIPGPSENLPQPIPAPIDELARMALFAPPMRGGEYLRIEALTELWSTLDEYVRRDIATRSGGLSEWLRIRAPHWHRVGRVCFHLAENKRDPENPFAFLATYAPKMLDGQRVQYQPLGKALEEYSGAKNRNALVKLLTPVQRASEKCAWVKELVDTGDVFHPLAWKPDEALRFLKDIPQLEESGVLVRVPNWWSKRPSRVRVGVSIGKSSKEKEARFGADAMLDFNVELTLDGEDIPCEEWESILQSSEGLVFLKGKWVEVDREKLSRALEHWKEVEQEAEDGISFLHGMRLLAGAPIDPGDDALFDQDTANWSDVRAGNWLEDRLRGLREPETLQNVLPGGELKATLRPYQQTGVKWLWFLSSLGLGACLADDMGLGKTIQVISLLLIKKREGKGARAAPALLVLPASLLTNWKAEVEKFAPSLVCKLAHPSMIKAQELQNAATNPQNFLDGVDLVLTTYSMLARLDWLLKTKWSLAVLDEAQAIKNPGARQTKAVKQLKADARIVLTGTPVENRLADLWSLFDFINPGLLGSGKAFGNFVKRMDAGGENRYAPLRKLAGPYILRRLKTDKSIISDLPDKIELQAFCNLTKKQAVLYEQSVRELAKALENVDGITRRGVVLAFIMRFKQICNHPAQWLGNGYYDAADSGKFLRLREICDELAGRQEKALIFTQYQSMTEPLADYLQTIFERPGLVLHGGTALPKRKKLVDEFQSAGGPPFMILSLKAGGTGLNLTAASHVIHFDRWWNPAVENQATDRAFRIGQKRNVMVHKFVCQGTIEEKIDAQIRDKMELAGSILESDGVPNRVTELTDADLLNLVKLDVNTIMED